MIDITASMAVRRTLSFSIRRIDSFGVTLDKFEYECDEAQSLPSARFELIIVYGPTIAAMLSASKSLLARAYGKQLVRHVRNAHKASDPTSSIDKGFMTLCDVVRSSQERRI